MYAFMYVCMYVFMYVKQHAYGSKKTRLSLQKARLLVKKKYVYRYKKPSISQKKYVYRYKKRVY